MEKVLSRGCHDSWRKTKNKMSSKTNQAELALVLISGQVKVLLTIADGTANGKEGLTILQCA